MSLPDAPDQAVDQAPLPRVNAQGRRNRTALQRLGELQRALQRQLKRKPNEFEKTALDRAALMSLRAEMAMRDPRASSEDIVRLDNAASRARAAFERVCGIEVKRKPKTVSMADVEKEIRAHG